MQTINRTIRIIVAGNQLFTDVEYFNVALTKCLERFLNNGANIILMVVDKMGINSMVDDYAKMMNLTVVTKSPQYQVMGRMALPQCYAAMVTEADCLVAFWDHIDKHVNSLITRCVRARKPYRVFDIAPLIMRRVPEQQNPDSVASD